ncbi:MAG: hypothetical protein WCQ99_10165 [Pseudomonadota bacterium]
MKNIGIAFIAAGLFFMPVSARAVLVNLSESQIKEAAEFGSLHKETIEAALKQKYEPGNNLPGVHEVELRTKWCKLALMSGVEAQQGKALAAQQQADILNDPFLQVNVTVYGQSLDFARTYTVYARQGDALIKPEKIHADHFQGAPHRNKALKGFPPYYATIRAYFKYTDINPEGKITIVLKKNLEDHPHELDLSAFK